MAPRCVSTSALAVLLSVFAIVNVAFWALLAWVWAVRPAWAARLPLELGSQARYGSPFPVWARIAAAAAAFWAVAAVIYLTLNTANRLALIALIVMAAIFLILGIGAAARVYHVLQLPKAPAAGMRRKAS